MSEQTIGRALRTRRAELGLDQRDAAARIGMSRTTFSSYERDTQRPSVDVLPAIARFLGVSIDDVLVLFGSSAIAAARTALARLNLSERGSLIATIKSDDMTVASEELVPSCECPTMPVFANLGNTDYSSDNEELDDEVVPDSATSRSAVSTITLASKGDAKVHIGREKGKKKKRKKEKREKLVNPAFATHV